MKKWYKIRFENKTVFTPSVKLAEELGEGKIVDDVGTLSDEYLDDLRSRPTVEVLEEKKGGRKR